MANHEEEQGFSMEEIREELGDDLVDALQGLTQKSSFVTTPDIPKYIKMFRMARQMEAAILDIYRTRFGEDFALDFRLEQFGLSGGRDWYLNCTLPFPKSPVCRAEIHRIFEGMPDWMSVDIDYVLIGDTRLSVRFTNVMKWPDYDAESERQDEFFAIDHFNQTHENAEHYWYDNSPLDIVSSEIPPDILNFLTCFSISLLAGADIDPSAPDDSEIPGFLVSFEDNTLVYRVTSPELSDLSIDGSDILDLQKIASIDFTLEITPHEYNEGCFCLIFRFPLDE